MVKERKELEETIKRAKRLQNYFSVKNCFFQLSTNPYEFVLIAKLLDGKEIVLNFPFDDIGNLQHWLKEVNETWHLMLEDGVLPHQQETDEG